MTCKSTIDMCAGQDLPVQNKTGANLQMHLLVLGADAGQTGAVGMQRGLWYGHVLLHDLPGLPLGDLLRKRCF